MTPQIVTHIKFFHKSSVFARMPQDSPILLNAKARYGLARSG